MKMSEPRPHHDFSAPIASSLIPDELISGDSVAIPIYEPRDAQLLAQGIPTGNKSKPMLALPLFGDPLVELKGF